MSNVAGPWFGGERRVVSSGSKACSVDTYWDPHRGGWRWSWIADVLSPKLPNGDEPTEALAMEAVDKVLLHAGWLLVGDSPPAPVAEAPRRSTPWKLDELRARWRK